VAVLIRPIERGDVRAASLVIQGGANFPDDEHEDDVDAYWSAVTETRARRGEVLVAAVDAQVVGVLQVLVFQHFQHTGGWCAELESVHVRHDLRGNGIGAELLAAAEGVARRAGCYRVQLTSRKFRVDAHRFYLAHGYEATSEGFKKSL
jgi:GNAT superfamily N-acetyltransferase